MNNFQREGSISNSHVGRNFENIVQEYFLTIGIQLDKDIKVKIGLDSKKDKCFDLGNINENLLVECKAHTWTRPNYRYPSAKITTWVSEMYKFYLTPNEFRKLFVVQYDLNLRSNETLLQQFIRLNKHLIPNDVELMEYDIENGKMYEREII
jgi:hypothetical protein